MMDDHHDDPDLGDAIARSRIPPDDQMPAGMTREKAATIVAASDLIGRSGAFNLEVGYLNDDPESADWWATATYRGAKLIFEHATSPDHALTGLLNRVLKDARCRWCGKPMTIRSSTPGRRCRWRLEGEQYVRGCTVTEMTLERPPFARPGRD